MRVLDINDLEKGHKKRLSSCSHLKHHAIPYTNQVIVYTHVPISKEEYERSKAQEKPTSFEEELARKQALLKLNFRFATQANST
jgi:hypothetical protein